MNIKRFLHVTSFIIAAIIVIGVAAVVAEEFSRRSPRTGEPPNISGTYLFKKENCPRNGCFSGASPKYTLGYLEHLEGEQRVHISQTSSGITINHAGWENKTMHMELLDKDSSLGWDQREFTYKWNEWAVQFGIERQSKVLHLFIDESRSLIIKTSTNKIGLALFLIPFAESMTYQVKLVRVDAS